MEILAGLTLIDKAIAFATVAHQGQVRKATYIPYITHPFSVAMLLSQVGCSEDVIIAGLLHDTLEDTETTFEELRLEFGETIAEYVQGCSEPDKSKAWEERKAHTIESLQDAPEAVCLIICADKIHNLRSMNSEWKQDGEEFWKRFKRGREKQKWYFTEVAKVLKERIGKHPLYDMLIIEMYKLF